MTMRKMSLILLMFVLTVAMSACGVVHDKPSEPGEMIIDDKAGLFDGDDKAEIKKAMEELSEYGHVGVYTYDMDTYSTTQTATSYYNTHFGSESGFLFVIDMLNRNIYIETDGFIGDYVTRSKALTITDNVYRYARDGEYGDCAAEASRQATRLMQGKYISQKMRIISGVFIAMLAAVLINFAVLRRLNRKPEVSISELSIGVKSVTRITNERVNVESRKFQTAAVDKANIAITILRILLIILTSGGGGGSGKSGGGGHSSHGGGHRF